MYSELGGHKGLRTSLVGVISRIHVIFHSLLFSLCQHLALFRMTFLRGPFWDHCSSTCISLYIGPPQASLAQLQLIQNAATINRHQKRVHISSILVSLHWLPVFLIIQFNVLLIVFNALNGHAPFYIFELIYVHSTTTVGPSGWLIKLNYKSSLILMKSRFKTFLGY